MLHRDDPFVQMLKSNDLLDIPLPQQDVEHFKELTWSQMGIPQELVDNPVRFRQRLAADVLNDPVVQTVRFEHATEELRRLFMINFWVNSLKIYNAWQRRVTQRMREYNQQLDRYVAYLEDRNSRMQWGFYSAIVSTILLVVTIVKVALQIIGS